MCAYSVDHGFRLPHIMGGCSFGYSFVVVVGRGIAPVPVRITSPFCVLSSFLEQGTLSKGYLCWKML